MNPTLRPPTGTHPDFRVKRAVFVIMGLLVILWVAMAAWLLIYYPERFMRSGPGIPVKDTAPAAVPAVPKAAVVVSSSVRETPPLPATRPQDCSAFFNIPGLHFYSWTAQAGETFLKLSARFRLKEATLRSLNQANSRKVEVLPEEMVLLPSKDGIFHMVREGQGLSDIARSYSVPLREVMAANRKMTDGDLKAGEILYLPNGQFLWDTDPAWITLSALSRATGFLRPIAARFSDAYGQRMHPVLQKEAFHGGLDLAAGMGTPVMASQDGKVIFEGPRGSYGNMVILDHGDGLTSWYGHLSLSLVKQGQAVKRGDVIGKVGRTGRSTGPHLHFEIRKNNQPQNPLLYLKK